MRDAEERAEARARAFAGRDGVDYWSIDRCPLCGAMPWKDARTQRIHLDHDMTKHGLAESAGEGTVRSDRRIENVEQVRARVAPVRRTMGEQDDD